MVSKYGDIGLSFGEEKRTSTDDFAGLPLGSRARTPDGRVFRYAFSQAAIGAGNLCMERAGIANHDMDLVVPAAVAIGARIIGVTLGATLVSVNQYKDGYLYVNDGAGEGHVYFIQSHEAVASAGLFNVPVGDDVVKEALDTASLCGLLVNPYKDTELYDANAVDGIPTGVAPTEIADNAFFWIQTWGPAAVLSAAVVAVIGQPMVPDGTTDGAIAIHVETFTASGTADTGLEFPVIGWAMLIAPIATDFGMTFLTITN